ncbi:hypothetical protein [Thermogemmatispora sp.]|uniref:hypothetical protein n=1 Tax=Thermogemmatispora sp. TaxID=1968838 RepID=UPI0035E3FD80
MASRMPSRPRASDTLRSLLRLVPWKLLLLLILFGAIVTPVFGYSFRLGDRIMPAISGFFYALGIPATPVPTPYPAFARALPQPGSLLYTVQEGDNCDEILTVQMHMADASQIFSDAKPETVRALSAAIGKDCHKLQPGMVIRLSPQYPLMALGGIILKARPVTPPQVLPTPLIPVPTPPDQGIDCSQGCTMQVRIAPGVEVNVDATTTLPVQNGSWIWAFATYPLAHVAGMSTYPYASPQTSLNGATLHACQIQIDDTYDEHSPSCDAFQPNTIDDDGGAWLLGVVGPSSLDHWKLPLHFPQGTRVLLWLTLDAHGNLTFHKGNAVYRYDEQQQIYVRA